MVVYLYPCHFHKEKKQLSFFFFLSLSQGEKVFFLIVTITKKKTIDVFSLEFHTCKNFFF